MFSKACRYGIRAVIYLAVHAGEERKIGVTELADQLHVPQHFLAKVLQQLVRDGHVASVKGPGGGFCLDAQQTQHSLAQVIESIDGPEVFSSCVLGFESCSNANPCPLHLQAFAYREGLKYQLTHHTIEEVSRRIRREKINI